MNRHLFIILGFILFLFGCDQQKEIEENLENVTENIFKIYDRQDLLSAEAFDLWELPLGGYILIGQERNADRPEELEVIVTNPQGDILREDNYQLGAPIDRVIQEGDQYLIFCQPFNQFQDERLIALTITQEGDVTQTILPETSRFGQRIIKYENGFLMLIVNEEEQQTKVHRLDANYNLIEVLFDTTFVRTPFDASFSQITQTVKLGTMGSQFYVYAPTGTVMGLYFEDNLDELTYADPWWLDALLDRGNGEFAVVNRHPDEDVDKNIYFLDRIPYQDMGVYFEYYDSEEILYELDSKEQTFLSLVGNRLVVAGSERAGPSEFFIYDATTTGQPALKRQEVGERFPYTVNRITPTQDLGLAILGTTDLAFQYSRMFLYKLSPEKIH